MANEYLATYLNDHLSGSLAALELFEEVRRGGIPRDDENLVAATVRGRVRDPLLEAARNEIELERGALARVVTPGDAARRAEDLLLDRLGGRGAVVAGDGARLLVVEHPTSAERTGRCNAKRQSQPRDDERGPTFQPGNQGSAPILQG